MNRIFPMLVYKNKGPNECQGGTYSYKGVKDATELEDAYNDGWHDNLPAALGHIAPVEKVIEPVIPDDNAAPTRAELEEKAKELGVKYTKKTSDEDLLFAIDMAVAE